MWPEASWHFLLMKYSCAHLCVTVRDDHSVEDKQFSNTTLRIRRERESAPSPAERVNESTVGNLSVGDDTAANVRVFLQ